MHSLLKGFIRQMLRKILSDAVARRPKIPVSVDCTKDYDSTQACAKAPPATKAPPEQPLWPGRGIFLRLIHPAHGQGFDFCGPRQGVASNQQCALSWGLERRRSSKPQFASVLGYDRADVKVTGKLQIGTLAIFAVLPGSCSYLMCLNTFRRRSSDFLAEMICSTFSSK
jgi:hypothetical protein